MTSGKARTIPGPQQVLTGDILGAATFAQVRATDHSLPCDLSFPCITSPLPGYCSGPCHSSLALGPAWEHVAETGPRAVQDHTHTHTHTHTHSCHVRDDDLCRSPCSCCGSQHSHPSWREHTWSPPPHHVSLSGFISVWPCQPWAKLAVRLPD